MKKQTIVSLVTISCILSLLLAGCSGLSFSLSFTTSGNHTTIEVNNAADGTTGESSPITVGKGQTVVVESALDKGEVRIDFAEAIVHYYSDEPDVVYTGDVITSVTIGDENRQEIALDPGEYILQVTTIGETNGKITVDRVK